MTPMHPEPQRFLAVATLALVALLLAASAAAAPPPVEIPYRGVLEDTDGPYSGDVGMVFKLYPTRTSAGGSEVWSEGHTVTVLNGKFSVRLGSGSGTPPLLPVLQDNADLYLAVDIGGAELNGRQKLLAVPYARRADDGIPATAVMFFDGPCPSGWSPYVPAQGRTLVGRPAAATTAVGETVGTDLADATPPSHGHVHTHTLTSDGALVSSSELNSRYCANGDLCSINGPIVEPILDTGTWTGTMVTASLVDSGSSMIIWGSTHVHTGTTDPSTAGDGASVGSLPYVQLRPCRKD